MKPTALVLSGWGPYKGVERADFEAMQRGLFLSIEESSTRLPEIESMTDRSLRARE